MIKMEGETGKYFSLYRVAMDGFVDDQIRIELGNNELTRNNLLSEIYRSIEDCNGSSIDHANIRLQLIIEEKLSPEFSALIRKSLEIFETIRDACRGNVLDYSKENDWIRAIKLSIIYNTDFKSGNSTYIDGAHHNIAKSICELKNLGFTIKSIDGSVEKNDKEFDRLSHAIDYRASKLGEVGLHQFNEIISERFSHKDMRFYIYRRKGFLHENTEPSIPYGYLLNLFSKHAGVKVKSSVNKTRKQFSAIIELATHLSTILNIENFSPYSNIHITQENLLRKITEWVMYPETFLIPQISPVHGKILFPKLFGLVNDLDRKIINKIDLVSQVLREIENATIASKSIAGVFSEAEVIALCRNFASKEAVLSALKNVSSLSSGINTNYRSPYDSYNANIKEVPLIRIGDSYLLPNIGLFNVAVYRALLRIAKNNYPLIDIKLGFAIEAFVKERLENSRITFHNNISYSISKTVRNQIGTSREQGECDFIIESKEYIILIETKKKGFTKKSLSGDQFSLLQDTILGFLRSVNQLTVAELVLLSGNKLVSENGITIELEGRSIFKLAISLDDMAALQCDGIKNGLLAGLYNSIIGASSGETPGLIKLNNTIKEFSDLHDVLINFGRKYREVPFHDISYVSIPQLLCILEDCDTNENFCSRIRQLNSVSYNVLDWYVSYKLAKNDKSANDYSELLKHSTMIK